MHKEYDEELDCTYAVPDCVDDYLDLIYMIGLDYDGWNDVKNLKELIDELVGLASEARKCLYEGKLFSENT